MAMKMKIITSLKSKRTTTGNVMFTCSGINEESKIVHLSIFNQEKTTTMEEGKFIIVKGYAKLTVTDDKVFIQIADDAKVSYKFIIITILSPYNLCLSH